jgi:DNA-binding NarL/FixJ family response regulator
MQASEHSIFRKRGCALAQASQNPRGKTTSGTSEPCRVFLVADRPVIRVSLAQVLKNAGFKLAGQAGGRREALAHAGLASSKVAVVSLLLNDRDTLDLAKALRARQVRSVICAVEGDSARVQRAFAAGASGYVTQRDESQHLFEAIRAVAEGRHYVSPQAGAVLARKISGLDNPAPEEALSEQQIQIYALLGQGESAAEIARRVRISPRTVESYCYRMIEKLNLSGMKDLRCHAIANNKTAVQ